MRPGSIRNYTEILVGLDGMQRYKVVVSSDRHAKHHRVSASVLSFSLKKNSVKVMLEEVILYMLEFSIGFSLVSLL